MLPGYRRVWTSGALFAFEVWLNRDGGVTKSQRGGSEARAAHGRKRCPTEMMHFIGIF